MKFKKTIGATLITSRRTWKDMEIVETLQQSLFPEKKKGNVGI